MAKGCNDSPADPSYSDPATLAAEYSISLEGGGPSRMMLMMMMCSQASKK